MEVACFDMDIKLDKLRKISDKIISTYNLNILYDITNRVPGVVDKINSYLPTSEQLNLENIRKNPKYAAIVEKNIDNMTIVRKKAKAKADVTRKRVIKPKSNSATSSSAPKKSKAGSSSSSSTKSNKSPGMMDVD